MTPDYIKQRAEALYPIDTTLPYNDDLNTGRQSAYIKGCTDTLEGSAGTWICATKLCEVNDGSPFEVTIVRNKKTQIPYGRFFGWTDDGDILFEENGRALIVDPKEAEYLEPSAPYTPLREADAVAFYEWMQTKKSDYLYKPDFNKKQIIELYAIFKGQQQQPATNYREVCEGLAEALELAHNRLGLVATDAGDYEALEAAKQQLETFNKLNKQRTI